MRTLILLSSLLLAAGCDDGGDSGSAPASTSGAHSQYGTCGQGFQNILTADQFGEPIVYTVEVDQPSGWVPLALTADALSAPTLYRTDDGGLWFTCPAGSTQWHVGWISA